MASVLPANLEQSKLHYLAQYAHRGCGGQPLTVEGELRCSLCRFKAPWLGKLGAAVQAVPQFVSLVKENRF